jgi:hypothetical protein
LKLLLITRSNREKDYLQEKGNQIRGEENS